MKRSELVQSMERYTGSGVITATELAHFLGQKNVNRVAVKYLRGIPPCYGKSYFIPEVADSMLMKM